MSSDLWVGLPTFKVGDKVRFNTDAHRFPGVFTVTAVNKVNLKVEGNGKRVSVHPSFLTYATDDDPTAAFFVDIPEHFVLGQTVRVKGRPAFEVYVVLKPTPKGYSCALIGGNDDRYLNCPVELLSAVKIDWWISEDTQG